MEKLSAPRKHIGRMNHMTCFTDNLNIYLTPIFNFPRVQHGKNVIEHLDMIQYASNLTIKAHLDVLKFIDNCERSLKNKVQLHQST